MIARVWRGWTSLDDAEAYTNYIEETGITGYRNTHGNQGAWILRRVEGDRCEVVTLSFWESSMRSKDLAATTSSKPSSTLTTTAISLTASDTCVTTGSPTKAHVLHACRPRECGGFRGSVADRRPVAAPRAPRRRRTVEHWGGCPGRRRRCRRGSRALRECSGCSRTPTNHTRRRTTSRLRLPASRPEAFPCR